MEQRFELFFQGTCSCDTYTRFGGAESKLRCGPALKPLQRTNGSYHTQNRSKVISYNSCHICASSANSKLIRLRLRQSEKAGNTLIRRMTITEGNLINLCKTLKTDRPSDWPVDSASGGRAQRRHRSAKVL